MIWTAPAASLKESPPQGGGGVFVTEVAMNDQLRRFLATLARVLVADGLEPTEAASRIREAASRAP